MIFVWNEKKIEKQSTVYINVRPEWQNQTWKRKIKRKKIHHQITKQANNLTMIPEKNGKKKSKK